MNKQLIIAEKPSVAKEIAHALGTPNKINGVWEVGKYVVTNCIGHLFSILEPKEFNPDWQKWSFETLPMIPERFRYKPNASTVQQWNTVKAALRRNDVTSVVNGCDAGREGELIFNLAYSHAEVDKPVFRMWTASLTKEAILESLANCKPAAEYQGLKDSAYLRLIADWLIGLNATRAFTLAANCQGEDFSLGRVQTPTLTLIVERDEKIENFKVESFWNIALLLQNQTGHQFKAFLIDEKKEYTRFENRAQADALRLQFEKTNQNPQIHSFKRQETIIKHPKLFDLTLLQREMNKRLGWTAAKTLEVAQSLYESQIITYPRTSSNYLSTKEAVDLSGIVEQLSKAEGKIGTSAIKIPQGNREMLKSNILVELGSDHHAIIPTGKSLKFSDTDECKLFEVIALRFLAGFYPIGLDERIELITKFNEHFFISRGTKVIEAGWREAEKTIEGKNNDDDDDDEKQENQTLTVSESDILQKTGTLLLDKKTRPPARFNEASLLGAMETAGKNLEDEQIRQAMKDSGLGTPATRAEIIEKLVSSSYIVRKGKQIHSTSKAKQVINNLKQIGSILVKPELTGIWEQNLQMIARNEASAEAFEESVKKLARKITQDIKEANFSYRPDNLDACPKCQTEKRDGFLKTLNANSGKYLVCTLGKEVCGYISIFPPATYKTKLLSSRCEVCKSAVFLRVSKEKNTPYLKCIKPDCKGIEFLNGMVKKNPRKFKKNPSRPSAKA